MRNQNRLNSDAELNLMPIISILAVCLSFLLLTAVWVQVGSFELNQGLGTNAVDENKKEDLALWVEFQNTGALQFQLKKGTRVLSSSRSFTAVSNIETIAESYKRQNPELSMAIVLPNPASSYQDLIKVMDGLRKNKINDIGIAPL